MGTDTRHDAWQAGDSYDAYMGRWSRPIAERFLGLLAPPPALEWLELGCGTGALTSAVLRGADPAGILALEPSEGFLAVARRSVEDARAEFRVGGAESLGALPSASRDLAVSGLVLNFLPDPVAALAEMRRIVRPGGIVALYVWDYPGGGVGFMRAFWTATVALDPAARDLTEDRRFPFSTREGVADHARRAGLGDPQVEALESVSIFADFDDYGTPFTLGAGPAPGYCAALSEEARQRLRDRLDDTLPREQDGTIALRTRAWAMTSRVV